MNKRQIKKKQKNYFKDAFRLNKKLKIVWLGEGISFGAIETQKEDNVLYKVILQGSYNNNVLSFDNYEDALIYFNKHKEAGRICFLTKVITQ